MESIKRWQYMSNRCIFNETKYLEKCFSIINTKKLKKLDKNPMVSYGAHIKRSLKKMKSRSHCKNVIKFTQEDQMLVNFIVLQKLKNYQN